MDTTPAPLFISRPASSFSIFCGNTNRNAVITALGNCPPSLWVGSYIKYLTDNSMEDDSRINKSKEDERRFIKEEELVVVQLQLDLVDALQHLGLWCYFEAEIMGIFMKMYKSIEKINKEMEHDLYAQALLFSLLREHDASISEVQVVDL